ncbi:hypothetical protein ABTJ92_21935, partial [Acinetobacter baumannii]
LDLAEVALEAAARLQGGADHDIEQGRAEHGLLSDQCRAVMPACRRLVKPRATTLPQMKLLDHGQRRQGQVVADVENNLERL